MTLAFLGASFVIAYIANSFREDERNIRWTRFIPVGIRTVLYFVSFGLLLFPIGAQTHIMFMNDVYTNSSLVEANTTTSLLGKTVEGGVSVVGKTFYVFIIILIILVLVLVIERILLKKKGDGYDKY